MSISKKLVRRPDESPKGRLKRETDDPTYGVREGRGARRGGCADMNVQEQIEKYIADQPQAKSEEIRELNRIILKVSPNCKLSFLDGRNIEDKIVSNPNVGYGSQTIKYAGGETREFYQIGVSANSTGISVYVIGEEDKKYLSETYGKKLGKAKITGYCIKFRRLADINIDILEEIVASHMRRPA
jgi:hypothetical protein